ncbi:hypothetical protein ACQEU5_21960 [Marinactinospora thermotolerans]|uniref:Uncharacterized protein n=1 Tax=Marinactinospora thermotolerans DSM 45154 TaxID=1122192 RepID=A0A1T4P788_9ACTN|nr:hypothetical protein [Marinactinospora thermotolerans]SJZ87076.1 hypothetical protein SAMN02745673_01653 [Marinactinospora thermotolerans DSM 45154]
MRTEGFAAVGRPDPRRGPSVPGEAPTLGEISATPASQRRQLNIGVPESLMLHRRAGLYRLDHRVDVQDQVAAALDAWLRERGY